MPLSFHVSLFDRYFKGFEKQIHKPFRRSCKCLAMWVRPWFKYKFSCLQEKHKNKMVTIWKTEELGDCLTFRVLTSSQDMLYSAKTVRQRAAILADRELKKWAVNCIVSVYYLYSEYCIIKTTEEVS